MTRRTVTIVLEVDTNLGSQTLEDRIESLIDPERLESELLGDEAIRIRQTTIEVEG